MSTIQDSTPPSRGVPKQPPKASKSWFSRIFKFLKNDDRIAQRKTDKLVKDLQSEKIQMNEEDQKALKALFFTLGKIQKIKAPENEPQITVDIPFGKDMPEGNVTPQFIKVIVPDKGKDLIVILPNGKILGAGATGEVHKSVVISGSDSGTLGVFKRTINNDAPAQEQLKHEQFILNTLYEGTPNNNIPGLPPKSTLVVGGWNVPTKDPEGNTQLTSYASVNLLNKYYEDGSLLNSITQKSKKLEEKLQIAKQTTAALAYMHAKNVIHHDVKPDNILVSGEEAVVTDFDLAVCIDLEKIRANGWKWNPNIPGSQDYISITYLDIKKATETSNNIATILTAIRDNNNQATEEQLNSLKELLNDYYNICSKKDVYATCVTLYEMFTDRLLEDNDDRKSMFNPENVKTTLKKAYLSKKTAECIANGLKEDYKSRPSASALNSALEKEYRSKKSGE